MKKFFQDFKTFISKGNVMDLAVGVIIGGAFQSIVSSFTNDIVSPILGLFTNMDFTDLVAHIGDVEIRYGAFITAVIDFLIMALVVFSFVRAIRKAESLVIKKKEEEPKPVTTKTCPYCKSEIAIEATRCPHCTSQLSE